MADEELVADLRRSRAGAQEAAKKIELELKKYARQLPKDCKNNQMKYCLYVLRQICLIVNSAHDTYYDVFSDIVERILGPCLHPEVSVAHWSRYLDNLRYLYYNVVQKKHYTAANRIFSSVASQNGKLQEERNYKPIMDIYSMHLMAQRAYQFNDQATAQKEIHATLCALKTLFTEMLQGNTNCGLMYPEILDEFLQKFCKQLNFLATLPASKLDMFEAFCTLLTGMKTASVTVDILATQCQRHLEITLALVQMDVLGKMEHPVAQMYLSSCRRISDIQSDPVVENAMALLYYYVKFVYTQTNVPSFTTSYVKLCAKFSEFFKRNTEDGGVRRKWFMDYMVTWVLLLLHVHQRSSPCFKAFWQQLGDTECCTKHLGLLLAAINVARQISESKLAPWTCCKSVRKHAILLLSQSALATYNNYVLWDSAACKSEVDHSTQQQTLIMIFRNGISVIEAMGCIPGVNPPVPLSAGNASNDLRMFYAHFTQITRDVGTSSQARFCLAMAEHFARLREKLAPDDWHTFLRRIYKTALLTDNNAHAGEYSSYIVAFTLQATLINWMQLRQQLNQYYNQSAKTQTTSLMEHWQISKSALKATLSEQQRRLFFLLETQHLYIYQKMTAELQMSLLRSQPTAYERILMRRHIKSTSPAASAQIARICEQLRAQQPRTRLDSLILAHGCTMLLHQRVARQKLPNMDSKMCMEAKLEELWQRAELREITIANELKIVEVALEALKAFEDFYSRADAEYITMDEAFIDWEAVMDDLVAIGLYFQFSGYTEHATEAWLLHYRIAQTINDQHNIMRALAYLIEHADYIDENAAFDLNAEVSEKQLIVLSALQQRERLKRREQCCLLLCVCQLAYYHARAGRMAYMQILLQLVRQLHSELPERHGKYDLVMSTWDAVRIRILWKLCDKELVGDGAEASSSPVLQALLLREMEVTLERFRDFTFISQSDSMPYMILLFNLSQQITECSANRLYDHNMVNVFASVLRMALQASSALRIVQILTMWMWANLQMEYVQKAEVKLNLIECVMGTSRLDELHQFADTKPKLPAITSITKEPELFSLQVHLGLETIRKMSPAHSSPVKVTSLCLSPNNRRNDLTHFLSSDSSEVCAQNELLQWFRFAAGCLNARLHYLSENHEHLTYFYEQCERWLSEHGNSIHFKYFRHFQLLSTQHYINYLRAHGKYEVALEQLEASLEQALHLIGKVDSMYIVNLKLQRNAIKAELKQQSFPENERLGRAQLRRTLTFDTSFEEYKEKCITSRRRLDVGVYTVVVPPQANGAKMPASVKKMKAPSFAIYNSDEEVTPPIVPKNRRGQSKNSQPAAKIQPAEVPAASSVDEFSICEAIELIDLIDFESEISEKKCSPLETMKPECSKRHPLPPTLCTTPEVQPTEVRAKTARKATTKQTGTAIKPKPVPATSVRRGRRRQLEAATMLSLDDSPTSTGLSAPSTAAELPTATTERLLRQLCLFADDEEPPATQQINRKEPGKTTQMEASTPVLAMNTRLRRRNAPVKDPKSTENMEPPVEISSVTKRRRQRT